MNLVNFNRYLLASVFLTLVGPPALRADISSARFALQTGRAAEARLLLTQTLASSSANPEAHQLLCRLYYSEEMPDAAISECSTAVEQAPTDSDNEMWLGRSYGLKASHSGPLTAYQLAKKVRAAFERAVELAPHNIHAMSDLGEFYVDAPRILGGGLDKAEGLAQKMMPAFPSQAHRLRALIALDRSDPSTAELEFKAAVSASHSPEAYVDLARFYERHGRPDEAVAQVQAVVAADAARGAALVDAAGILTAAKRRPELAEELLRQYLSSNAKSDAAPAFQVHLQLSRLLRKQNDLTGAQKEADAALALAPDYLPAQKAAQSF